MSEAVFIDLGEDWSVVEERRARERPRPALRAPLAALLLLVVLLLAGGSAVSTSPLTPLATFDAAGVSGTQVGAGAVVVAGGTGDALFVARYASDTGAMTWKTAVPERADALTYLAGAGVLTVWFYDNGLDRVTVLDAATGARLWELSGDLHLPASPDAKQALTVTGDPNTPAQARYVDLRTGQAIWTRAVPAQAQVVVLDARLPSDAAGFVVAAPDGTVTLLGRDTGAVLSSLKIDPLVPDNVAASSEPDIALVESIGGRLLVMRRIGAPNGEIASYDLPGLTLSWLRSGLLPGYPLPCGPNLCLSGVTGAMIALDPATGASRWTNEDWQDPATLGGGRMLAFRSDSLEHAGILDSTTGHLVGDLGNWTIVSGPDIHFALQPVRGNFRSTWVGVVDPGRATVRPVGRLDGLNTRGCISRGDLLVCPTTDAKVRAWRYQPGQ